MILLADGGSTSVHWCLTDKGQSLKEVFTQASNPFFRSREEISTEIKSVLMPQLREYDIRAVYFYGAGCIFDKEQNIVKSAIAENINAPIIEVSSDLMAAAKSLCGKDKGIACIIGTGSNSCYYDGVEIKQNVSPLGYILGDEASGAVLGRIFLGACLKNQLTGGLKKKFLEQTGLTLADILDKVYKQPMPNRFLASISPFLKENINDPSIYSLVYKSFDEFFVKNVMQYDYKNNKVHFTGSVAFHYQEILKAVATNLNIEIGKISQSPMKGLIQYYSPI